VLNVPILVCCILCVKLVEFVHIVMTAGNPDVHLMYISYTTVAVSELQSNFPFSKNIAYKRMTIEKY
jgi:hypothetical protein